jgi:hypothetical protein
VGPTHLERRYDILTYQGNKRRIRLLGGGLRSFQKYESGKVAVSVPMSNLLRLLSVDPARIEELRLLRTSRQPVSRGSGVRSRPDSRSIREKIAKKAAGTAL